MEASSAKLIRSLERGLDVLQSVQTQPGMKLRDLHDATGLPKATLLRILRTLTEHNLIWQRMADGAYLSSCHHNQLRAERMDSATRLCEVASPILRELCQKVNWPSVLTVPRDDCMEVIESNCPKSHVQHLWAGLLGFKVSYLLSASGRAYLSFCSQNEREALLERLRASHEFEQAMAQSSGSIVAVLSQTRAQGYGRRDPSYRDDGRDSIAVPIIVTGVVIGCLNLTWSKRAAKAEGVIAASLPDLRQGAADIASRMLEYPAELRSSRKPSERLDQFSTSIS